MADKRHETLEGLSSIPDLETIDTETIEAFAEAQRKTTTCMLGDGNSIQRPIIYDW